MKFKLFYFIFFSLHLVLLCQDGVSYKFENHTYIGQGFYVKLDRKDKNYFLHPAQSGNSDLDVGLNLRHVEQC